MAASGKTYTHRVKQAFIIEPESFAPWALDHHFNTEDPMKCFNVSFDEPLEH